MVKKVGIKIGRDAVNGQFIPVREAQQRSREAVVETIRRAAPIPTQKRRGK